MTPECRATLDKYRESPRPLDPHLLARLRALQNFHWAWTRRRDRLTLKLGIAAGVLAAVGIAEVILTPGHIVLPIAGLAGLAAVGARVQFLNARQREFLRLAREGHSLLAYVVMANTALFEPGDELRPAAVVISADEQHRFDEAYLSGQAAKLWALRGMEACPSPDQQEVWAFMRNDFSIGLRHVPQSLAGDDLTYLGHLIVDPAALPGRCLKDKALPVLMAAPKIALTVALLHV
ncbi:MAG: hypothetical protein HY293_08010 [Planctomycetes bacterium]|nr:hypothetical protein [Planctomycetota bacterium]